MTFTKVESILDQIIADLTTPVTALVKGIHINRDEPINLVYSDLPSLGIYPLKEDFIYDDSFNSEDKKQLQLRLELRMKEGPASTVCTPVINIICSTIKADPSLGGLANYVEIQTIQWANDQTSSGVCCGAAIDVQVNYFS